MLNFTYRTDNERKLAELIIKNAKCDENFELEIVSSPERFNEEYDFAVLRNGNTLLFDCPIYSFAEEAILKYINSEKFGCEAKYVTDKLYYSDFGAVGDGVAEDFLAIKSAHAAANLAMRHTVYANDNAKYYICLTGADSIVAKTDTNFGNAQIIIDDSLFSDDDKWTAERSALIYKFVNLYPTVSYTKDRDPLGLVEKLNKLGGVKTTDEVIPLELGYKALIVLRNTQKRMYNRGGEMGKTGVGHYQQELLVLDEHGRLTDDTALLFDFDNIDEISISRADTPTLKITGGKFVTIATRNDMQRYTNRGIGIYRSNVIIDGMDHYVENQPLGSERYKDELGRYVYNDGGPNYNGFLMPSSMTNLLVINSKFCGRTHYRQGSYDLFGSFCNKMVYRNCTQYNMFREDGTVYDESRYYWGIMGTSYCKNIEYYNSTLSRLDAHAGVYNIVVKDCDIMSICGVGGGTALIENSNIYNGRLFSLRPDYGSSWRGKFIIKNCEIRSPGDRAAIIDGIIYNADYGYNTVLPDIYVENVTHNKGENYEKFYLLEILFTPWWDTVHTGGWDEGNEVKNNFVPIQNIVIKNQKPGYKIAKYAKPDPQNIRNFKLYENISEE